MTKEINKHKPVFAISTVSEMIGVSADTLRMYEREGLIIPFKKESHHRLYSRSDVDRFICIRKAITQKKMNIAGINAMLSLVPCWEIMKCSHKDRENCEAYNGNFHPCWSYTLENNVCASLDCKRCIVYREYCNCENIKDKLKEIIK